MRIRWIIKKEAKFLYKHSKEFTITFKNQRNILTILSQRVVIEEKSFKLLFEQGCILKQFKNTEMVDMSRSTIYFTISMYKFVKKHLFCSLLLVKENQIGLEKSRN